MAGTCRGDAPIHDGSPADGCGLLGRRSAAGLWRRLERRWLGFVADLRAAPAIMREALAIPLIRRSTHWQGNVQEVMIGYSDSNKDGGFVASERAIMAHAGLAIANGAEIRAREAVVAIEPGDGRVTVVTERGREVARVVPSREGVDPYYLRLAEKYGAPTYARIDAPADREQKARLGKLSAEQVSATELAGEPIETFGGGPLQGIRQELAGLDPAFEGAQAHERAPPRSKPSRPRRIAGHCARSAPAATRAPPKIWPGRGRVPNRPSPQPWKTGSRTSEVPM